jgi:hypothetical protein
MKTLTLLAMILSLITTSAYAEKKPAKKKCGCFGESVSLSPSKIKSRPPIWNSGRVALIDGDELIRNWSNIKYPMRDDAQAQHAKDAENCLIAARFICK